MARRACRPQPCVAGNSYDYGFNTDVFSYDGTGWSQPTYLGIDVAAQGLSCGSPTFCVAVGDTEVSVFDGTTWSTPSPIDAKRTSTSLDQVSCPSDDFCMIADHNRDVYIGK